LGLTAGTVLQYFTRSFVARKKNIENVSEENKKKLIHCPRKSLIFQDFQGPMHIFQVFQSDFKILNFHNFPGLQDPYEPCLHFVVIIDPQLHP